MAQTHRKRGAELENAILDAALHVLQTNGYDQMTMTDIASAAQTNKNTIYRRWETKLAVVTAAIQRFFKTHPNVIERTTPDTGNLRDDLMDLMMRPLPAIQVIGIHNLKAIALAILPSVSSVKFDFMNDNYFQRGLLEILQHAEARGDLKTPVDQLPAAAKGQPTLLLLSYILSERPYDEQAVVTLVDSILLPVLTQG